MITPAKKEDSAYRAYDTEAIEAFEPNLAQIGDEITALSTIRSVIKTFKEKTHGGA